MAVKNNKVVPVLEIIGIWKWEEHNIFDYFYRTNEHHFYAGRTTNRMKKYCRKVLRWYN